MGEDIDKAKGKAKPVAVVSMDGRAVAREGKRDALLAVATLGELEDVEEAGPAVAHVVKDGAKSRASARSRQPLGT